MKNFLKKFNILKPTKMLQINLDMKNLMKFKKKLLKFLATTLNKILVGRIFLFYGNNLLIMSNLEIEK